MDRVYYVQLNGNVVIGKYAVSPSTVLPPWAVLVTAEQFEAINIGAVRDDGGQYSVVPNPGRRQIARGDFISRITVQEHMAFKALTKVNDEAAVLWDRLMARDMIHLDAPELVMAFQFLKSVGIPAVWADAATADARLAQLFADA